MSRDARERERREAENYELCMYGDSLSPSGPTLSLSAKASEGATWCLEKHYTLKAGGNLRDINISGRI